MKINLNDRVSVKLTKRGIDIMLSNNLVMYEYNYDGETHTVTTELWDIMNTFGSHMYNGCDIPFEKNSIEIHK